MARPNPIQYAERLYAAIRAANFSPISFLAFGNAIKEGIGMRHMPRIAAEPFMRVVGDMLDLEDRSAEDDRAFADALIIEASSATTSARAGATGEARENAHAVDDHVRAEPATTEPVVEKTKNAETVTAPPQSVPGDQKQAKRVRKD